MSTAPRPRDEAARLAALRRYGVARLTATPSSATAALGAAGFADIAALAMRLTGAPMALVSLVDEERVWHLAHPGTTVPSLPRDASLCAHAIAAMDPGAPDDEALFEIADARADLRFAGLPMVAGDAHVRWYAAAPLRTVDGYAIGVLAVMDAHPRPALPAADAAALAALARQALTQLELRYSVGRLAQEVYARRASDLEGPRGGPEIADAALAAAVRHADERERAAAEEDRRRAREMLQRQATAMETANDGIAILDREERLVYANDANARMYGYDRGAELWGLDWRVLYPVEEHRRIEQTILPALRRDGKWRGEAVARRRDGSAFAHEMSLALLDDGGLVAVVRDVSERQALDRMKNEFVSTVSHELRTPLTSIRGSLGLIEGGVAGPVPDKALELLRIARANADRLIRLINDILDLDKMESGRLELSIAPLEPSDVVTVTLEGIHTMADARRVHLVARIGRHARFLGDRDRVIQVLTNLVSNAIKFSPEDSDVTVRVVPGEAGFLRFAVEDTGPGIPPEMVPRLFRKFGQLDASDARLRGGTGLGLVISRSIVEQHGGTIGVHSEPGVRTQFWFELPLVQTERVSLPPFGTVAAAHTILLVEGDEDLADILTILLAKEGYHTVHASTPGDAWRVAAQSHPSAVLLDAAVADGAGLEFLGQLRSAEKTSALPVVVLSAREREDSLSGVTLVDWLTKPFDEQRLFRALRRAVRAPGAPRALVVDDDAATRMILTTRLRALGVECTDAPGGIDALRMVQEHPPDLIVLDVGMPDLDGFAFVDALRQQLARATPLIVYTGRDLSAAERKTLTLGPTMHLTKARASEDDFVHVVRGMLEGLLPARGTDAADASA